MIKCPLCDHKEQELTSLSYHYRFGHYKSSEELYVSVVCSGNPPSCKCGCGGKVKFLDISRGFSNFIRGHSSRVKNNFQSDKAKQNSLETRRKMLETGDWKPFASKKTGEHWSKGLAKETDARIAKMASSIKNNQEEIDKRSARMKKNRLNGTIPTLRGKEHSQWKGGVSSLLSICHSNRKLYAEWKYPKLYNNDFSCQECKKAKDKNCSLVLEVHHDKVKMSTIIKLIAEEKGWNDYYALCPETDEKTQALKAEIADAVADFHIKNNVSGIVLCETCHEKEHEKYNL